MRVSLVRPQAGSLSLSHSPKVIDKVILVVFVTPSLTSLFFSVVNYGTEATPAPDPVTARHPAHVIATAHWQPTDVGECLSLGTVTGGYMRWDE